MKVNIGNHKTWGADWYVLDYRPNGTKGDRIRENVHGREEAIERKAELEGQPLQPNKVTFPRLRDIVDDYLAQCERKLASATVDNKRQRLLKHIIPVIGHLRAKDLNQNVFDRYGANMKPSVYIKDVHHISALVSWMVKRRHAVKLDWVPEQEKMTAKVKRLPRMMDAERCIAALPKESHQIMCRFMLYSGLRWNEVRNLCWENCDSYMDLVTVDGRDFGRWERSVTVIARATKNGDEEIVSIPSNCHEWFDQNCKKKGLMFEGKKDGNCMTRICYSLDLAYQSTGVRMTPHMFRHVSGTELYRRTKDIFRVMQHLRHKNLKDTMIYVRYAAIWQRESVETLVTQGKEGQNGQRQNHRKQPSNGA